MDQPSPSKHYGFLGYRLETQSRRLLDPNDKLLPLSERAFDTLHCLVQHSGQTLSKDFLITTVWPHEVVEENNLNQAILTLRKALGDSSRDSRFIRTITRRGFCFIAPVTELEPSPRSAEPSPAAASSPRLSAIGWLRAPNLLAYTATLLLALGCILLWPQFSQESTAGKQSVSSAENPASPTLLPDSLAILPFRTVADEPIDGLFSAGLHAELISRLSTIDGISIIGRESTMAPAIYTKDIAGIREALRVEYVMSGTILFHAGRARINLELIDSSTLFTLWASSYEIETRSVDEVFAVQGDIALNVAQTLAATLDRQMLAELQLQPTRSNEAYSYFLASRQAFEDRQYERAWSLGKQAVEMDPSFLDAIYNYSHINAVLIRNPVAQLDNKQHLELALEQAQLYIELAPERPQGYTLRAVALSIDGDWKSVLAEFDRIGRLGFKLENMRFNSFMLGLGKIDVAVPAFEKRMQINPLNPYNRGFLMIAHEIAGNRQRSRELYATGNALHGEWWGHEIQMMLSLGRHDSLHHVEELGVSDALKRILRQLDDREQVRTALLQRLADTSSDNTDLIYYAAVAAHIDEQQLALRLMRAAIANSWTNMLWTWLPVFDEVRADEAFYTLIDDFGVTEYWDRLGWPEVCPQIDRNSCQWQATAAL